MRRCATQVWPVLVSDSKESVNSPEPVSDLARYLADFGSDRYFFGLLSYRTRPECYCTQHNSGVILMRLHSGPPLVPPLPVSKTQMVCAAVAVVECRYNAQSREGLFLMHCLSV